MNMMCSRCKKRIAVIFMTRMDGGSTTNEGLCIKCAKELGIQPINDMMEKMGLNDEAIDAMDDDTFELYLKYHFFTCEREDLAGITGHAVDMLRK